MCVMDCAQFLVNLTFDAMLCWLSASHARSLQSLCAEDQLPEYAPEILPGIQCPEPPMPYRCEIPKRLAIPVGILPLSRR